MITFNDWLEEKNKDWSGWILLWNIYTRISSKNPPDVVLSALCGLKSRVIHQLLMQCNSIWVAALQIEASMKHKFGWFILF